MEKVLKKHQNDATNHIKIDAKPMLESVMQQIQKIIKHGAQKGTNNHPKNYQKTIRKKGRKTEHLLGVDP